MTDDQIFQKKQECAGYKDEIQNEIEKKCESYQISNIQRMNCYLEEIYFNKKANSCEYSWYWNYYTLNNWIIDTNSSERRYYVNDYLSSKEVYSNVCWKTDAECNKMTKAILKEIKGE